MKIAARCTLILLALASPLRADRIVVDGSGGGDFLDIQPAIDSALDGDVIEVRSGSYGPAVIDDKELVLAAGTGASAVGITGHVWVLNLSAGKSVVLSGLTNQAGLAGPGLLLDNCQGSVRIQDCAFSGHNPSGWPVPGGQIQACTDVQVSSVAFSGSIGLPGQVGGPGLRINASRVTLSEGFLIGGRGGAGSDDPALQCNGHAGGTGLIVQNSQAFLRAGSVAPGLGGDPGSLSCMYGPDGHGIYSFGTSTVQYLGTVITGAQSGSIQQLPGVPRGWQSLNVFVNTNAPFPLFVHGEPGDRVVMISSLHSQYRPLPSLGGNLVVGAPFQAQFLGVCDAFGSLQAHALYLVPGGGQSEHIFVQTLHFPRGVPTRALGNGRVMLAQ